MYSTDPKRKYLLGVLLFSGLLLAAAGCANQNAPAAQLTAKNTGPDCAPPACASLIVTQSGRPDKLDISAQGIRPAAAPLAQPKEPAPDEHWVIDTGIPSPDGKWAAYTSIGEETGGPVLLQNLESGMWTNLIESINAGLPQDQPAFREDYIWDVIGWFPDSTRLMIGPADLSLVTIVDLASFSALPITFPGGGRGGRLFVDLSFDGTRFLFIGDSPVGNQVLGMVELSSGQQTDLLELPYDQGVLYNPRFSPDQKTVAYLVQKGSPDDGLSYSIDLLSPQTGEASPLIEGNLGMTVPVWSPDSSHIAYTRKDTAQAKQLIPGTDQPPETENLWVVSISDGEQTQLTFLDGQARSPVWARDSKILAFVTNDGQVGMTNLDQPGQTWQVAGPSEKPELTNVFFLP